MVDKINWYYDSGNKVIYNVPVVNHQGEQYFEGSVSIKMSEIAEYMNFYNLVDLDYEKFHF